MSRQRAQMADEPAAVAPVPLLDADGAAGLLNVPKSWILAQARDDLIPHVRLGRYVRFHADDLHEWAKARSRGPSVKEPG